MSTAYLLDVSGSMPWSEIERISKEIPKLFRPGDQVIVFDHKPTQVVFIGNPTPQDILKGVDRNCRGGTDLQAAIDKARSVDPSCELVVFSDGDLPPIVDEYELVKV